jgi:hypothetical protein
MTREQKILALTKNEIEWAVHNGDQWIDDITTFFAKGGFNAWSDSEINDSYQKLVAE